MFVPTKNTGGPDVARRSHVTCAPSPLAMAITAITLTPRVHFIAAPSRPPRHLEPPEVHEPQRAGAAMTSYANVAASPSRDSVSV
jgi:hypothetical protein